ncbi:hypothetical protein [Natronobacterium gregoryi]|uniref:DUF8119 domain-containing protein n=2 Tax=Natronobacterium gregoryi TaxID=44930 RepID=L0AH00_NATGS|nr:hypothetical protein [Natronobacterium gregoryi]AFZ72365.1 hypothetical protein Natgr_1138 [Natronobacterium gregoryi SP2]ELY64250.1 hypothetical protein C490_14715 [Natronobacterium gregoryi SP2]PLK20320.1 hypothetical protein CYV19_10175 [Natronobacterium gregoryi SP2]SFJ22231.1 hypothetical protein SAMN05443661_11832 [Natronobacterium gregoryi]
MRLLAGGRGRLAFLVDGVLVVCLIVVVTLAFRVAGWPLSADDVVVFGGVMVYSLALEPWVWRE